MEVRIRDVVVIGGGAAGLSAALVLGRARRQVAVVDAGAPRNAPARHMQGYLSRDGMSPKDLLSLGRAEVTGYGVELIEDQVVAIQAGFAVRLAGGQVLQARRILVATGARDELPTIAGVRERWGQDLLHCPYCHGWEVRDQPIGVLGTQHGSVEHALLVRQWSADVIFFVHDYDLTPVERLQLEARGVQVVVGEVVRLVIQADRLTGVELLGGQVIARTAVFIRPGLAPHADGLLAGLGCEIGETGFATVDGTGRTSVFGVWAAGNVVDPRAQVITAAGAGSAAAIAINADLVREDVERAMETAPEAAPGDLTFSLTWSAADGALRGVLEARNSSEHRLRLSGKPRLVPLGVGAHALETPTVVTAELLLPGYVELDPGESAVSTVGWAGWDGPPASGIVIVEWPGGHAEVPVVGPHQPAATGPTTNLWSSWFVRVDT